jgi:hypothetical protein
MFLMKRKSSPQNTRMSSQWRVVTKVAQSVLPEWHWWHLPLPSAPMQTPFSQACWCEWHVGTKCRGVTEESDSPWISPLILVQKDRLWIIADWTSQSRAAFYSQGSTTPLTHWQEQIGSLHWTWKLDTGRQHCILKSKRRCVLHWANTVAVHNHAFQHLPCSSDIWMANGVFLGRPDLLCWWPPMQTTWLSNCKTHTTSPTKIWKWTGTAWRHYIWPVGQLSWFPIRWPSLVLPPYPEERKVTQAAVKLGRPIQCSNTDKSSDQPNPAASNIIPWRFQRSQTEIGYGSI